jgi:hypothetical protein
MIGPELAPDSGGLAVPRDGAGWRWLSDPRRRERNVAARRGDRHRSDPRCRVAARNGSTRAPSHTRSSASTTTCCHSIVGGGVEWDDREALIRHSSALRGSRAPRRSSRSARHVPGDPASGVSILIPATEFRLDDWIAGGRVSNASCVLHRHPPAYGAGPRCPLRKMRHWGG